MPRCSEVVRVTMSDDYGMYAFRREFCLFKPGHKGFPILRPGKPWVYKCSSILVIEYVTVNVA
jgi:hypothetical protein